MDYKALYEQQLQKNKKLKEEWKILNEFCGGIPDNDGQAIVDWISKLFDIEDRYYVLEKENKKLKEENNKLKQDMMWKEGRIKYLETVKVIDNTHLENEKLKKENKELKDKVRWYDDWVKDLKEARDKYKHKLDVIKSQYDELELAGKWTMDDEYVITPLKESDEDDSDEEDDSDDSDEDEYTIEINVVGLGWCRYVDEKDRDEQVVHCKNGYWKMKGDKTAKDCEGNYCETESDEEE